MTDFERIKFYYDKGWADVEKLRLYVQYNVITSDEFTLICGLVY